MSWISVATFRHQARARYLERISGPLHGKAPMGFGDSVNALDPLICGLAEAYESEARRAHEFLRKHVDGKGPPAESVLRNALTMGVYATLDGYDPRALIEAIAKTKRYDQPRTRALHQIAKRMADPKLAPKTPLKLTGSPADSDAWTLILPKAPSSQCFDLAAILDSPIWFSDLRYALLPLIYCQANESGHGNLSDFLLQGMYRGVLSAPLARRILYERAVARRAHDDDIAISKSWHGFDALTVVDGVLHAYYYLGAEWVGPMVFREEVNLFWFLDALEEDWTICADHMTDSAREEMRRHRTEKSVKYVIVYDARDCQIVGEDLTAAARFHKIELDAVDVASCS